MCLLSWDNALKPPLPLLSVPVATRESYQFQNDHPHIASKDIENAKAGAAQSLQTSEYPKDLKEGQGNGIDDSLQAEKNNNEEGLHDSAWRNKLLAITKHLSSFYVFASWTEV